MGKTHKDNRDYSSDYSRKKNKREFAKKKRQRNFKRNMRADDILEDYPEYYDEE